MNVILQEDIRMEQESVADEPITQPTFEDPAIPVIQEYTALVVAARHRVVVKVGCVIAWDPWHLVPQVRTRSKKVPDQSQVSGTHELMSS